MGFNLDTGCSCCSDSGTKLNDIKKASHLKNYKKIISIVAAALLFVVALVLDTSFEVYLTLIVASYMLAGGEILYKAGKNIIRRELFDENFLMTIATLGAFIIGEYPEGVAVMLFYQVGVLFEDAAVAKSRNSIESLVNVRPDYANLLKNGQKAIDESGDNYERVSPEEVKPGDIIVVKPGEKIPLDGKVVKGASTVDTSILTGEAFPLNLSEGDEALAGYININGLLKIEITREFEQSTVSKIFELVQNASSRKSHTEKFITRFARVYTPVVVMAAAAIAIVPPLLFSGAAFSEWFYRALVFLVISCPCALVISIPMGFVSGIGKASREGILVKGSNYLEALNDIDTVIFDKTGTITRGIFEVDQINPAPGFDKQQLLELAGIAEAVSDHPVAKAIRKACRVRKQEETTDFNPDYDYYEEIPGRGVKVRYDNMKILAGNEGLLKQENIEPKPGITPGHKDQGFTYVHVGVDGEYAGYISVSDRLKDGSKSTVDKLRKSGVERFAILTGDVREGAVKFAEKLGIDQVYAKLLPQDKLSKLEEIYLEKQERQKSQGTTKSSKGRILYVGDGINDAPVLARADVGIAMGGLGSDAAIQSSDIVLMTDEPPKLISAINIARQTRGVVWQNIVLALGVKLVVLLLGAMGMASMWQAVIADVGVMVVAVFNSLRLSF